MSNKKKDNVKKIIYERQSFGSWLNNSLFPVCYLSWKEYQDKIYNNILPKFKKDWLNSSFSIVHIFGMNLQITLWGIILMIVFSKQSPFIIGKIVMGIFIWSMWQLLQRKNWMDRYLDEKYVNMKY